MTSAARLVLEDCRQEILELEPTLSASEWRRHSVTLFVLLRALGHVLDKVDGESALGLRHEVNAWWKKINQNKEAHPLFWKFIELERNSVIKEYATSAHQIVAIQVGAVNYDAKADRVWSDPPQPTRYLQQLTSGHFAGQDLRTIANEAIQWWENQLNEIELGAKNAL